MPLITVFFQVASPHIEVEAFHLAPPSNVFWWINLLDSTVLSSRSRKHQKYFRTIVFEDHNQSHAEPKGVIPSYCTSKPRPAPSLPKTGLAGECKMVLVWLDHCTEPPHVRKVDLGHTNYKVLLSWRWELFKHLETISVKSQLRIPGFASVYSNS